MKNTHSTPQSPRLPGESRRANIKDQSSTRVEESPRLVGGFFKPNVILISIDTLRADHLSCYGYQRRTTPNIDRLAEDAVLFENAYSTAAWTPPAHASMLTGRYPSFHGVVDTGRLGREIPTLAEALRAGGYRTAGFVNNSQVGELVGLEKGHEAFVEVWKGTAGMSLLRRGMDYLVRNAKDRVGLADHGADRTNRLVRSWLREKGDQPFYLFIHYIEPHNPINAPHPFKNKFREHPDNRNIDRKKLDCVADNPLNCYTRGIRLNADEIAALKALYDGEVNYIDHKLGELLDYLKKERIYDNSLIIVTADHGEHFGEHDLYSHVASLYEPILRIPLIIKYPEGFHRQTRVAELVQLVDIFPTVVETAGLDRKFGEGVQGTSLVKTDSNGRYHDFIVSEWEGRVPHFVQKRMNGRDLDPVINKFKESLVMIREGRYKFISNSNGREELYDLAADRGELTNLIEREQETAADMRAKLTRWRSLNRPVVHEDRARLDEATRKNLESLGYL